jgi:hypothetical protein
MFRVLVAVLLVCAAVQMSGCTGSLRLGSTIHTQALSMFG